jgi:hypothetical protein
VSHGFDFARFDCLVEEEVRKNRDRPAEHKLPANSDKMSLGELWEYLNKQTRRPNSHERTAQSGTIRNMQNIAPAESASKRVPS